MTPRRFAIHLLWLALAAAWLFALGWTILSSFKTLNVAIFERLPRSCSAEWHSAVSQVGNLRGFSGLLGVPISNRCRADCQSAIQQIDNLRYLKATRPAGAEPTIRLARS
jgi:ABC-type glycerol-3-phosphate transport system permease component